jgi:hypothetical protein
MLITAQAGATGVISIPANLDVPPGQGLPARSNSFKTSGNGHICAPPRGIYSRTLSEIKMKTLVFAVFLAVSASAVATPTFAVADIF